MANRSVKDDDRVRSMVEDGTIRTWADGYGIWHASVRPCVGAMMLCRQAIWLELRDRGPGDGSGVVRPTVELVEPERMSDTERVEYRETNH